ncbi:MAG: hypothetical protein NXI28_27695, partial [bacterium]|nr:hypothetical protein [bacterium]
MASFLVCLQVVRPSPLITAVRRYICLRQFFTCTHEDLNNETFHSRHAVVYNHDSVGRGVNRDFPT